jgi:hypothetical protein
MHQPYFEFYSFYTYRVVHLQTGHWTNWKRMILLCTGFSETMSEEKAASLDIKDFLLKPIVVQ